jgi:H+/Cl- antiporter ClcA
LVRMAATTAASIHAPLTAAVMIFELSGDYPIVLPLLVQLSSRPPCREDSVASL